VTNRLRRSTGWVVKLTLTAVVTYFLFRFLRVSWGEISTLEPERWRPRPVPFVGSFVLLLLVFAYLVGLWALMVRSLGGPALRLADAFRIFFIANLGRYVPGKVWQLAGLTYLAGKKGVSIPVASSAAILGQIYSLGAAAVVAAVGLSLGPTAALPDGIAPGALALAALAILLTTVPSVLRPILLFFFRLGRSDHAVPEIDSWFGLRWLGLYLPAWVGYGMAFGLLWASFPELPPAAWPVAIGGFAGAYFIGYAAAFAPAGVGVREGALAVLLAPGMGPASATVLAVIARLWMTAGEIVPVLAIALTGGMDSLRRSSRDS
jgi:uncharacterized membrane protein YbhN (UPF0104 family)